MASRDWEAPRADTTQTSTPPFQGDGVVPPSPSARRSIRPRDPILDPWADEATLPPRRAHPEPAEAQATAEDDAVTSAVSTEVALAPAPTPPPDSAPPVSVEIEVEPAATPTSPTISAESLNISIGFVSLDTVDIFADLPVEIQARLATTGTVENLEADEQLDVAGLALVLGGDAAICAAVSDVRAKSVGKLDLVSGRGTLRDSVALCLIAGSLGATVAHWPWSILDDVLRGCPWVLEELGSLSDQLQILAGATLGPLGELDEATRAVVMNRLRVEPKAAGEIIATRGSRELHLVVVGAGSLTLFDEDDRPESTLGPGDWLFPRALTLRGPCPATARTGPDGALLLTAERSAAHELFMVVPPLLVLLTA